MKKPPTRKNVSIVALVDDCEETYSVPIYYKTITFPSGEIGIEFDIAHNEPYEGVTIKINSVTTESIMELMFIGDYFRTRTKRLTLNMAFIPFARQDRETTPRHPFTLKTFAKLLNTIGFDEVECVTPHSNVPENLINNLVTIEPNLFPMFTRLYGFKYKGNDVILLAPDAGAEKRVYQQASKLSKSGINIKDVVTMSKQRDPATGNIIGYRSPVNIPDNMHLLVLDDICDGGRTFIELAKVLPTKRKSLTLYVTHGIFSKGTDILKEAGYDNVSCYNDMRKDNIL